MKKLTIILLSIVVISCNNKPKTQAHIPKWQWIYQDHSGGFCIDTALCYTDLRVGDTVFVTRKVDSSVVFYFIDSSRIKNEYEFHNVKFYNGTIDIGDTAYIDLTKTHK